ncbi:hypothetical protein HJU99_004518 [Escherichia coli]|nr:hypothetical protein [Escherichia coli]
MKKLIAVVAIALCCTAFANTNEPNSGVIPQEIIYDGNGKLVNDTEKLPMTGQWCSELDHKYRRPGNNCLADY